MVELKEIVAPTMKELFIKEIENKIISGEWPIGMKLPSEREMEIKMKVSRTIINTGLNELARCGFVKIEPRVGVFVGDYIKNGNIETLNAIMNFHDGKLDKKTFDSLTFYRIITDTECAYLAALNRTNEQIMELKKLYNELMETNDLSKIIDIKLEFTRVIYEATGNVIYPLVYNSFNHLSLVFSKFIFEKDNIESKGYLMVNLINAIEDKKAAEAKEIMRKMITIRIEKLKQHYFD